MKTIKTSNANVSIDLIELKFQNLNAEDTSVVTMKSKSELFRAMYDAGLEICEISKECESHYSFVYGVIANSREVRTTQKATASDDIRRLAEEGKTPGEIAKLLNKNYSFVFGVVKKYKEAMNYMPAFMKSTESIDTEVPVAEEPVEVKSEPKKRRTKKTSEEVKGA